MNVASRFSPSLLDDPSHLYWIKTLKDQTSVKLWSADNKPQQTRSPLAPFTRPPFPLLPPPSLPSTTTTSRSEIAPRVQVTDLGHCRFVVATAPLVGEARALVDRHGLVRSPSSTRRLTGTDGGRRRATCSRRSASAREPEPSDVSLLAGDPDSGGVANVRCAHVMEWRKNW